MKRTILFLLVLAIATVPAEARKHKKSATSGPGPFDYYLLSLSWAPNYCAGHPSDRSSECRPGGHVTFVLHGLWPQSADGAPPMSCAPARPVAEATVRHMTEYFPSASLIQHEWEKHGTCSGLEAGDYFAKVEQAYKSVKVPDQYRSLDRTRTFDVRAIEQSFAAANNAPVDAFRISCHDNDLVGVDVCLDKGLKFQACTRSARECRATSVQVTPPK